LRIGIYPGSFDPVTLGHWDIITRAASMVDRLVVAVLNNPSKVPHFSVVERLSFLKDLLAGRPSIEVTSFEGLLVDCAKQAGASLVVRGIRAFSDFEHEFQMALANRLLAPDLETVFLLPEVENSFISSRIVREVGRMGGDISGLVPAALKDRIAARLR
jgi:pantetheine-phosphate adenylyltransferase